MFLTAERIEKCQTRELMFRDLPELAGYVGLPGSEFQCINTGAQYQRITDNTDITVAERDPQDFQILQPALTQYYPRAKVFNQYLERLTLDELPQRIGLINNDIFGNVDNVSLQWLRTVIQKRLVPGGALGQTFTKHYRANSFIPFIIKMLRDTADYRHAAHHRDIVNNSTVPAHSREIAIIYYLLFRDYVLHGCDFRFAFCFYQDTQSMGFIKCYDIKPKHTERAILQLPDKPDPRPRIRRSLAGPKCNIAQGENLAVKKLLARTQTEKEYVEQQIQELQAKRAAQGKNPNMVRAGIDAHETRLRNTIARSGLTIDQFRKIIDFSRQ